MEQFLKASLGECPGPGLKVTVHQNGQELIKELALIIEKLVRA